MWDTSSEFLVCSAAVDDIKQDSRISELDLRWKVVVDTWLLSQLLFPLVLQGEPEAHRTGDLLEAWS